MAVSGADTGDMSFETDRARFIGRGRTLASPRALTRHDPLSGSEGPVLDPIVAIRQEIILDPDQTATIDLVTGAAVARDTAEHLIQRYQDRHLANRVFDLAWTHNQVVLQQFGISRRRRRNTSASPSDDFRHASLRRRQRHLRNRGQSACGLCHSATCRSCCCRSQTSPTSASCASSCARARTGD
jgi:cellobiose phosphorylase